MNYDHHIHLIPLPPSPIGSLHTSLPSCQNVTPSVAPPYPGSPTTPPKLKPTLNPNSSPPEHYSQLQISQLIFWRPPTHKLPPTTILALNFSPFIWICPQFQIWTTKDTSTYTSLKISKGWLKILVFEVEIDYIPGSNIIMVGIFTCIWVLLFFFPLLKLTSYLNPGNILNLISWCSKHFCYILRSRHY
jgi:hypothetical protein